MSVQELIQKLILAEVTLSQGLLLARMMYKNSLSVESYAWLCHEIDHYEDPAEMPEYRIVDCEVKAVVSGYYIGTRIEVLDTSVIKKQLSGLDKPYASPNKMLVRQGIESIEQSWNSLDSHVEMELTREQMGMILEYYSVPEGCRVERMYQQCHAELIKNIIPNIPKKTTTPKYTNHNQKEKHCKPAVLFFFQSPNLGDVLIQNWGRFESAIIILMAFALSP